jgi:apolipoprotein N-acyltransferase
MAGFIDPHGRTTRIIRYGEPPGSYGDGALAADITVAVQQTVYTRYGDVVAYLCVAAGLTVVGVAFVTSRR